MKRVIVIVSLIFFSAACNDHDFREVNSTSAGDTTLNKADSLLNNPGTGYGNETTDTLGISNLGSGTDTSGSLDKKP